MAASPIFSEISEQFLRCKICFKDFNTPKLLPCLHSFCKECLEGLIHPENRSLDCPVCKHHLSLYDNQNGVDGLRDNDFISSLTETMGMLKKIRNREGAIVCTCCSTENDATSYCLTCADLLCSDCIGAHTRLKVFKGHDSMSLDELRSGKYTECLLQHKEPSKCEVHDGEMMRFYCRTCEKPICRDCTVLDHKEPGHKYCRLTDAVTACRAALKKMLAEVRMKISLVTDALKSVSKSGQEIARGKEAAVEKIRTEAQKRQDDIVQMRMTLERETNTLSAIKEKQLSDLKDSLDLVLLKLNSSFEFTETVLKMGSDRDILSGKSQIETRLKELTDTCVEAKLDIDTAVKFIVNYDHTDPLGTVVDDSGTVVDGPTDSDVSKHFCKFLFEFGKRGSGPGEFCDPEGVAVTKSGDIVVADKGNCRIQVFDKFGSYKYQSPEQMFKTPTDVTVNADNHFVTVDYGERSIKTTSIDRCHVTIRKRETDVPLSPVRIDDHFWNYLHGVAVDRVGHVIASSSRHDTSEIRVFTPYGIEVSRFGESDMLSLDRIFYMCIDSTGQNIVVSDHGNRNVRKFSQDGQEKWSTDLPGHFLTGICCDDEDNIMVVSYRTGQVLMIRKDGTFAGHLVEGLNHPEGIAFTTNAGKKLVVVDGGNNRVKVYQYFRKEQGEDSSQ
ncbi:E3 ubiquitin-protein ligase TRIM71-like [Glandiceps talaboti]